MEVKFELLDDLLIRFFSYVNVCTLGQDMVIVIKKKEGTIGDVLGGGSFSLDKKGEGVAGSVLGGGSFLRREGVPGTRKEAPVIKRRRGFSWF